MIDWHSIIGFQWDKGNASKSETKHGVTREEAEQLFTNEPLVVAEDAAHSEAETRFHALGQTDAGRQLHASFTVREALVRPISVRPMNRKEKAIYEKAK
ncbi:MAG: BrnT family toxin [Chthoniobacterales bacterium]